MREVGIVLVIILMAVCAICCCCVVGVLVFGTMVQDGTIPSFKPTPQFHYVPLNPAAVENMEKLEAVEVPVNDPVKLAEQLKGIKDIPETVPAPAQPYQIGDTQPFWITNVDTNKSKQITARLEVIGEHVYLWAQEGVSVNQKYAQNLVDAFDQKIYPTDREFFGSEWTPGIDNDPRLYILYAKDAGAGLAGYFSSADEVHPLAHKYSNAKELFLISADNVPLNDPYILGTMAHEFQHMIHHYRDRNETSWLNEGFSVMAELLNGYDTGGFDSLFMRNPDMQLTDWLPNVSDNGPHYGASFLFVTYFLDRFGEEVTQNLVKESQNGMDSIDTVLARNNITDPLSGKVITADDVFVDWTLANFIKDREAGDGRYFYSNYPSSPQARASEKISKCASPVTSNRYVYQYGTDYIEISCMGSHTFEFQGTGETGLLPQDPRSGDYAFWSNKGDDSDMTLTKEFDFTQANGQISFSYNVWYDLEEDYDYLYLEASLDGETWQILDTPACTSEDPSGNSYGCGYNGKNHGWREQHVDLSKFGGQKVLLRFEYITDAAVNGEGLMLDDLQIQQIGYETSFEADDGGWEGAGFVRVQNRLPQTYRVSVIHYDVSNNVTVEKIEIDDAQKASFPVIVGEGGKAVVVVSGTTRFTRQPAAYQFEIR